MTLSLTNRNDMIANSFSIVTANGSVVVVLVAIQGTIVRLPPSILNTLEKLSQLIQMIQIISKAFKRLLTLRHRYQQLILRLRLLLL
jgi:hypothetical protein